MPPKKKGWAGGRKRVDEPVLYEGSVKLNRKSADRWVLNYQINGSTERSTTHMTPGYWRAGDEAMEHRDEFLSALSKAFNKQVSKKRSAPVDDSLEVSPSPQHAATSAAPGPTPAPRATNGDPTISASKRSKAASKAKVLKVARRLAHNSKRMANYAAVRSWRVKWMAILHDAAVHRKCHLLVAKSSDTAILGGEGGEGNPRGVELNSTQSEWFSAKACGVYHYF
jgi:hypothetical protein